MTGETPSPAEQHKTPAEFARILHKKLSDKLAVVDFKPTSYSTTILRDEEAIAVVSDDNSYMLEKRSLATMPQQRLEDIKNGEAIVSIMDTNATNESNRFLILKPHSVNMNSMLGRYLLKNPEILLTTAPEDYAILQVQVGRVIEPYPQFIDDMTKALDVNEQ